MDKNSQQMQTFCNTEQGLSYGAQMDAQHASLGNFGACALCAKAAAVIFCHNDNASLCSSCDLEIHASNPLAAQHERVPIVAKAQLESQISCVKVEAVEVKTASGGSGSTDEAATVADECDNAASLFTIEASTPLKPFKEFDAFDLDGTLFDMGLGFDLGTLEMDFLPCAPVDGVVPKVVPVAPAEAVEESSSSGCSSDSAAPAGANLSSASSGDYRSQGAVDREAAAAPDAAGGAAAMPALPAAKPASSWGSADSDKPMNRLDRVRRYREKRARRTFQKTIRYQSRKAYAEIRPRIKGRFATREEVAALKAEAALKAANAAGMTPSSSYSNLRAPAMLYL